MAAILLVYNTNQLRVLYFQYKGTFSEKKRLMSFNLSGTNQGEPNAWLHLNYLLFMISIQHLLNFKENPALHNFFEINPWRNNLMGCVIAALFKG